MIDLILWAADKPTIEAFALTHGLFTTDDEGAATANPGVAWSWWGGTGKVLQSHGVYDQGGNEVTPPAYLGGMVAVVRLHGAFFEADKIGDTGEQWERSKFVRYLRDNGTSGTVIGLHFYELDGVRIGRHDEVNARLAEWGAPGHEFAGGVNE